MKSKQVFISYHTHSSYEMVKQICDCLEERGISCWYAPRNVEGDYATSIVNAIEQCRIFLVILNKSSNYSEDVRNEINCAFERVRRHEEITILPFRVDDSVLSSPVKYYLGRMHIMDGSIPPEILRIYELADRISVLLDKIPEKKGEIPDGRDRWKQYCVTGTMVYADKNFVGRTEELEKIHAVLSGNVNKVFLEGMGGIGKSEIAKTYCARFRQEYDVVLWISFSESIEKTMNNDYVFPIDGLKKNDYPDDTARDYFLRKLDILKKISDRRLLIVVDNFDVVEDPDLEEFCKGSYSVIFTSRSHNLTSDIPEIEVSAVVDKEELLKLFYSEYKRMGNQEEILKLLEYLKGHPLSIRLIAAAMQSNRRLTPETMIELLKGSDDELSKKNAKTAELLYGRLRQVFQLSGLKEEELNLLKILALVPLSGITVEELFEWNEWENYDIIDELIRKSWIVHNAVTDEVHLHPVIAQLFKEELQSDAGCCDIYVRKLIELTKVTKNYSWHRMQQLAEYCDTACDMLPDSYGYKEILMLSKGSIFLDTYRYEESLKIFSNLLESTTDIERKLFLYHKVSHVQVLSGDAQGSIETAKYGYHFLETLDMTSLSLDAKYMKKVLLQRIGEASREIGDYETAIEYGKKAISVCDEYQFDSPELSRGWAVYHLARTLIAAKHWEEAWEELDKATELFELIRDKWSAAYCYTLYAKILCYQKRYNEAMRYVDTAWEIHVPHYGECSKMAAGLLMEKGTICQQSGDAARAREYFLSAAAIYRKCNFFKLEEQALEHAKERPEE